MLGHCRQEAQLSPRDPRGTLYQLKCWPTVIQMTHTQMYRVSLKNTFSNCHILFTFYFILFCTRIIAVGSTIAQRACDALCPHGPHQSSPVHTSNNVEATVEVERFFRQCRMLLRHCCHFWQQCCRFRQQYRTKFRPSTMSKQIEHVQFCFDFVEGRNFFRHCCRLWQQSRMLFRQSRTLLRQCCWCGRGLSKPAISTGLERLWK